MGSCWEGFPVALTALEADPSTITKLVNTLALDIETMKIIIIAIALSQKMN